MLRKISLLAMVSLTLRLSVLAQDKPAMADVMRSNGKIYVVVGVIVVLFIGLIAYLVRLDRKISRLEKENS